MAPSQHKPLFAARPVRFLTDYEEQASQDDSLVIPEDLTALSDEDLSALQAQAPEAFNAIYQNGEVQFTDDDLAAMASLTEGLEALAAEDTARQAAAEERREQAAALAARVQPQPAED